MLMPLTKRPGEFAASVSSRVNVTLVSGLASTFVEMNTRPRDVAAQSVVRPPRVRWVAASVPPTRSEAGPAVSFDVPSLTQSPHCGRWRTW